MKTSRFLHSYPITQLNQGFTNFLNIVSTVFPRIFKFFSDLKHGYCFGSPFVRYGDQFLNHFPNVEHFVTFTFVSDIVFFRLNSIIVRSHLSLKRPLGAKIFIGAAPGG